MSHNARFGAQIIGTGHHVPARVLSNDDLTAMVDTSDEWIMARTGVKERRIASERENSGTLALEASRRALTNAGIGADDLDLIIVCTFTPEMLVPSTACLLQHRLGVGHKGMPAFDLQAACSGFIYGLATAHAFMQLGQVRHALVVGVDTVSRAIDYTNRATCILFGDGAGAAVLRRTDDPRRGVLHTRLCADGSGHNLIYAPGTLNRHGSPERPPTGKEGFVHMDGPKVYKLAVTRMQELLEDALVATGHEANQIDLLIPHQANRRILESVAERFRLRNDQVYVNVERLGNTSAASIPIAYDECNKQGRIHPGDLVLLVAFGAGLTWASAVIRA